MITPALTQPALHAFYQHICLFEDEHIVVVNKPAGLLTVPGKTPDLQDCLLHRLHAVNADIRLVHRLDRDTSGILIFAKHKLAQQHLSKQFELKDTKKTYTAWVLGHLHGQGSIDMPVRYEPTTPPLHVTDIHEKKQALTHWQAIDQLYIQQQAVSHIALFPVTGRSHQLRVHCQHIGHAIVGDTLYAPKDTLYLAERLYLHASQLVFTHPHLLTQHTIDCPASFTG